MSIFSSIKRSRRALPALLLGAALLGSVAQFGGVAHAAPRSNDFDLAQSLFQSDLRDAGSKADSAVGSAKLAQSSADEALSNAKAALQKAAACDLVRFKAYADLYASFKSNAQNSTRSTKNALQIAANDEKAASNHLLDLHDWADLDRSQAEQDGAAAADGKYAAQVAADKANNTNATTMLDAAAKTVSEADAVMASANALAALCGQTAMSDGPIRMPMGTPAGNGVIFVPSGVPNDYAYAEGYLAVPPTLQLSQYAGPSGTQVTISGWGFIPNQHISFCWVATMGISNCLDLLTLNQGATADSIGHFTLTVHIPTSVPGVYRIDARDQSGRSASANFTVLTSMSNGYPW